MTTRYTLEQIREFIACPELGDDHYGKWGAMTREQRLVMNDLIERAKEYDRLILSQDRARRAAEKVYIDTNSEIAKILFEEMKKGVKCESSAKEMEYIPTFRFIDKEQA